MIVDGQGSPPRGADRSTGATAAPCPATGARSRRSTAPRAAAASNVIGKQLWDRDDAHLVGLGMFYFLLTQAMFPGEGNEGKVMGLAPHGDPDALGLPPLDVDGYRVTIPRDWRELMRGAAALPLRRRAPAVRASPTCANLAAAGQRAFEEALLQVAALAARSAPGWRSCALPAAPGSTARPTTACCAKRRSGACSFRRRRATPAPRSAARCTA